MQNSCVDTLVHQLKCLLPPKGVIGVLFSGGLDSSVLLTLALAAVGTKRCVALHAETSISEGWEATEAKAFCENIGARLVRIFLDPLCSPEISQNTSDRCYHCKLMILGSLIENAKGQGIATFVDGSTLDDDPKDRPGYRALHEFGVLSPLRALSLGRADIRQIAAHYSFGAHLVSGSCMATRFKTGTEISADIVNKLRVIERQAKALGCRLARARYDGKFVRLEVEADAVAAISTSASALSLLAFELGFTSFSLDPVGYRGEI